MYTIYDLPYFIGKCVSELACYGAYLAVIALVLFIARRFASPVRCLIASAIAVTAVTYNIFAATKLELLFLMVFPTLLIGIVYILNVLALEPYEGILMFAAFVIPARLLDSSISLLGDGVYYLIIWAVLKVICCNHANGGVLCRYVMLAYLALNAFAFNRIQFLLVSVLRNNWTSKAMVILWIVLFTAVIFLVTYILKRNLSNQIESIRSSERRYPEIAAWGNVFEIISLLSFLLLPMPFIFSGSITYAEQNVLAIVDIIILILEIIYLVFAYKLTAYKHTVKSMAQQQEQEKEYYHRLENNLNQIADLRHDIKNIFLTMSRFVENSGNPEMQEFYAEKICPFVGNELRQNAIFTQLCGISSEELRAFLFMKISLAVKKGIDVRLNVGINDKNTPLKIELVDLTRIIGILFDNAVEECEQQENAFIDVSVSERDGIYNYSIKNSVRPGKSFNHMLAGKSDKPEHSGRGLRIVRNIIDSYPAADLSTFFDQTIFWQSLTIR